MCQPGSKIKFCTCENSSTNDNSIAPQDEEVELKVGQFMPGSNTSYFWFLYKCIGTRKSQVMGSMVTPSDLIGADLTREYILQELNREDCFDFDYTPINGDFLLIRPNTINYFVEYILVKHEDGKWTSGFF